MPTANTEYNALRITELDFFQIKENLKSYLRNQAEFQDFNFEGSGMSILLDILAYNTHYMGYYLNMVGNEMFLDTAQLRNSVISHAKNLNYVPTSPQGALVKANVVVTPSSTENQNLNTLTLDKYTRFLAKDIDGVNFQFVALNSNTVSKVNNSFTFRNIMLKQGEVITHQYLMDSTNINRRFDIPSANVDTTTLSITVQESSANTFRTEYKLAEDITEITGNSAVYFIEENPELNYTFYFGDNILGKKPANGNIIIATYLDVVGSIANNISNFQVSSEIGGEYSDNVSISSANSSYGGTNKESLEQIRYRAPYFYTTQNRAVTIQDYQTLITKDYNNIDSVAVWGGEDNDPVVYGKVYLSLKTKDNYSLSNLEKENIKTYLIKNRNTLTVTPEIVDPEYVYILIRGNVHYNPKLTSFSIPALATVTANELLDYVKASIEDYNDDELNKFASTFRKSKLQNYIDNAEKSILGSDITVYLQKRVELDTTQKKNYEINFNIPLKKGDYVNKLFTNPLIKVLDSSGDEKEVYFEEVPLSATGVDSITILNPGINYTSIPTVTINGDGSGAKAKAVIRNNRLARIEITDRGSNYNRAEIVISGGGGSEARAIARLEAKTGTLRTYYYTGAGNRFVVNENAGDIDYDEGKITLSGLVTNGTTENPHYDTNVITFNVPVSKEIITPLRNRILSIDMNDSSTIQIEMIAEK